MNYSNSDCRIRRTVPAPLKTQTPPRPIRIRKSSRVLTTLRAALAAGALGATASAQFIISIAPGLFTPSFRDLTNTDLGSTTFFGWGPAPGWNPPAYFRFDGATDDEVIDNPAALLGVGGLTGTLNQTGTDDILAGSNNIYTGGFLSETLSLTIPTFGTPGTGFTTIIIQGQSANFGPGQAVYYPPDSYNFPTLGGAAPDIVTGTNANHSGGALGLGQFWVKYEIPGNAASYNLDFDLLNGNVSIAELQVDTQWSATGFAPDTAQAAPEPGSAVLLLGGTALLGLLRRRECR